MKHLLCSFIILFFVSGNTYAEEVKKDDDLTVFLAVTQLQHYACALAAEAGLVSNEPLEKALSCINKYLDESKKSYYELKKMKKNEKITSMVKDYYAMWITSMYSIAPEAYEPKSKYKERIARDERKLSEVRQRIYLEIDP